MCRTGLRSGCDGGACSAPWGLVRLSDCLVGLWTMGAGGMGAGGMGAGGMGAGGMGAGVL